MFLLRAMVSSDKADTNIGATHQVFTRKKTLELVCKAHLFPATVLLLASSACLPQKSPLLAWALLLFYCALIPKVKVIGRTPGKANSRYHGC